MVLTNEGISHTWSCRDRAVTDVVDYRGAYSCAIATIRAEHGVLQDNLDEINALFDTSISFTIEQPVFGSALLVLHHDAGALYHLAAWWFATAIQRIFARSRDVDGFAYVADTLWLSKCDGAIWDSVGVKAMTYEAWLHIKAQPDVWGRYMPWIDGPATIYWRKFYTGRKSLTCCIYCDANIQLERKH